MGAAALKQRLTQPLLELSDRYRYGGLGYVQISGCDAHAAVFGDGEECADVVQGKVHNQRLYTIFKSNIISYMVRARYWLQSV